MNQRITSWLRIRVERAIAKRPPDFVIGKPGEPYMQRWFLIPRNPLLNIYAHRFLHDDEDRALHDHPWWSLSVILSGGYMEITHCRESNGPAYAFYMPGDVKIRSARYAHRIKLTREAGFGPVPALTLFVTGPRVREWGFHCAQGWRHWRDFTSPANKGAIGRGCD